MIRMLTLIVLGLSCSLALAEEWAVPPGITIELNTPTWDELVTTIEDQPTYQVGDPSTQIVVRGLKDIHEFLLDTPEAHQGAALLLGVAVIIDCPDGCRFTPKDPEERFRFADVSGYLGVRNATFEDFSHDESGAVVEVSGNGRLDAFDVGFISGSTTRAGGAVSVVGNGCVHLRRTHFYGNSAVDWASDVNSESTGQDSCQPVVAFGSQFYGYTQLSSWDQPGGISRLGYNTFAYPYTAINNTGTVHSHSTVFHLTDEQSQKSAASKQKPQDLCQDFAIGTFNSLGYNVSSDDSCDLDQPSDLAAVDTELAENEQNLFVPQANSPLIDSGMSEAFVPEGQTLAELPCGYKDLRGVARPQDANADGVYECDRGAVEVQGAGQVVAGHSAVFYNPDRNGEGNYVEILDDGLAVVYTFTYNPMGDGPAWFIGVGDYSDNQIVMDSLLRPSGTPFGDDFDPAEIDFAAAGSMSMVFPDCAAAAPGGSVAYTGAASLGFEGLLTRATRLGHILGCGDEVPSGNAGLSGSFYDPARNGEGLIIEWLTGDQVLAVFFTFDDEGNQFWAVGQGAADGTTVTMDVVYPTGFTPWGQDYNAADVVLESWGTFTLTWTDCHSLSFEYSSAIPGFGQATRNYTRLSTLSGTSCPAF